MVYEYINVVTLSTNQNRWFTVNKSGHRSRVYYMYVKKKKKSYEIKLAFFALCKRKESVEKNDMIYTLKYNQQS